LIESSFSLITALILIVLVTGFCIYEIQLFNYRKAVIQFSSDLDGLVKAFDLLPRLSDEGSFTSIKISVPKDYNLTFSSQADALLINGKENLTINLSRDLINDLVLSSGTYDLELYYGGNSTGPYVVSFK